MRQDGFYWVKDPSVGWIIAEWDNGQIRWRSHYSIQATHDEYFEEIDERRIVRPEPFIIPEGEWIKTQDGWLFKPNNTFEIILAPTNSPTDQCKEDLLPLMNLDCCEHPIEWPWKVEGNIENTTILMPMKFMPPEE